MIAYITFEYALKIHDELIEEYGGRKGILHEGLLRSALEMPKACFNGQDVHPIIFDKTAAYLFYLIQNHPFIARGVLLMQSTKISFWVLLKGL